MEETKSKLRISEDIPIFGGDEALEWIQRLEVVLQGVSEEEKLQASMEALEGRALTWFQWWKRCNPNPSWEGFKIAVVRRFQPSKIQNPFELLLSLKQEETVEDYVKDFEKYVGALREIDPEFVKGTFLKGLKEEIRVEVQSYEFHSLSEIIQKTILVAQEGTGSKVDSAPEEKRTFEAEASPENPEAAEEERVLAEVSPANLETATETNSAVAESIQNLNLETEDESEMVAEEERVAAVAIQRFDLETEGEPTILKEERGFPGAKTLVLNLSTLERSIRPPAKPPNPPGCALDIAKLEEAELCPLWSCRRVVQPLPPPAKPPELWRDGGCNVAPLDLSSCEGISTRGHSARTERAEIKVWTCKAKGPSPNLRLEKLGHTDDWAQISGGSHSTQELFSQLLLVANSLELYQVPDFTKDSVVVPHALRFGIWDFIGTEINWLRWKLVQIRHEIGSGHAIGVNNAIWIHDIVMVMTVVELLECLHAFQVEASSVYEHRVRNISLELLVFEEFPGLLLQRSIDNGSIYFSDSGVWTTKPHKPLLFQRDQSYRIAWYSVPAFLLHWQLSAAPFQPHAFVELDAEFQNWGFLGAEFHILTWRTEELLNGSCTTWMLCYMQWDPGGSCDYCHFCIVGILVQCSSLLLVPHLEDKVNFQGGSIDRNSRLGVS